MVLAEHMWQQKENLEGSAEMQAKDEDDSKEERFAISFGGELTRIC